MLAKYEHRILFDSLKATKDKRLWKTIVVQRWKKYLDNMREKKVRKRKKSSSIRFMLVTISSNFLLSRPYNKPHSAILYYNFHCKQADNASNTQGFTKGIENEKNLERKNRKPNNNQEIRDKFETTGKKCKPGDRRTCQFMLKKILILSWKLYCGIFFLIFYLFLSTCFSLVICNSSNSRKFATRQVIFGIPLYKIENLFLKNLKRF